MSSHVYDNHATAKRDDVDSTVSELIHGLNIPWIDAHSAQNMKHVITTVLGDFWDRAVAEGRYLEIMDPSTPEAATLIIADGPPKFKRTEY